MKGIFHGEKAMFFRGRSYRLIGLAAKEPRELERTVDGFRAAIGEEDAVEPRPGSELASERALVGIVIEVRKVNGARSITANHFNDARMGMAEGVHSDAAEEIEIFFAGGVKDVGAAAVRHHHGRPFVSGEKKLFSVEQARVRFDGGRLPMF
jgi:hypothetical protein